MGNNFFSPTPDTVSPGTVTFVWATPSAGHNVTWVSGPSSPAGTGTITEGFLVATVETGTYFYRCTNHTGMNGYIIVE